MNEVFMYMKINGGTEKIDSFSLTELLQILFHLDPYENKLCPMNICFDIILGE